MPSSPIEFGTDRLHFRVWPAHHVAPFVVMNGDAEVMRYFPAVMSQAQSQAAIDRWTAACLDLAFTRLKLEEVVAITSLINRRSIEVMQRIGMNNADADFDHPSVPEGHALRRHCLYRITREEHARRGTPRE